MQYFKGLGSISTKDAKHTLEIKSINATAKEAFNNKEDLVTDTWRKNCLLKHIIEGKIERVLEMMGRRGKRRKQLLDDLTEERGNTGY